MNKIKIIFLNHKKIIIITFCSIFIMLLGFCYFYFRENNNNKEESLENILVDKEQIVEEIKQEEKIINYLYVDIKGYVNKPGVYKFDVNSNSRISDLLIVAGGVKKGGNTSNINLAKKLFDEMTVIIYSSDEINNYISTKNNEKLKNELCNSSGINTACINDEKEVENKIVNINKASKEELLNLDGIGESKAIAIIEYRNINGLFTKIEDIMNVSGIGESLFQTIKDNITIQ